MENLPKYYTTLFNAVTDAIELISRSEVSEDFAVHPCVPRGRGAFLEKKPSPCRKDMRMVSAIINYCHPRQDLRREATCCLWNASLIIPIA